MTDAYGNQAEVGDIVACSIDTSYSQGLRVGIIASLEPGLDVIEVFLNSRRKKNAVTKKSYTVKASEVIKISTKQIGSGLTSGLRHKLVQRLLERQQPKDKPNVPCGACTRNLVVKNSLKCFKCKKLFHNKLCLAKTNIGVSWCYKCEEPEIGTYRWHEKLKIIEGELQL